MFLAEICLQEVFRRRLVGTALIVASPTVHDGPVMRFR